MLVRHGMLCASARVRRTTWAARLGVRAAASTRSVSGRAAALARRGRATFATILGAQAGGPARPRTRCSRLCAGAPVLRPGQSQRCLDAVRGRRMRTPPRRRACCVITFLEQISIPEQISRFSLQFEVSGGWLGDFSKFCVSDNKVKCEFINTIPDSSFALRALACVEWAR